MTSELRTVITREISVVVLYNDDGQLLLQHRTLDAPVLPNHWAFFGGGIEKGETPERAAKRECLEELGYQLTAPRLLFTRKITFEGRILILNIFVERYDGGSLTLGEGQGMGWFRPEETKCLLMSDHDRAIIRQIEELLELS